MRTNASLRHHVADGDGTATGAFFPGRGLCCPDDPLELVLQLFPAADRAPPPPSSLAALGIGAGGGDPSARRVVKKEPESPPPQTLEESDDGGVGGAQDSWGLVLDGLSSGLEEIDVSMFFADDEPLDNGGEATQGNLLSDPTTHMAAADGGGPVHLHTQGSLGVVPNPNDASPFPSPMPAGAFPLQAYDAFDAAVFNNASAPPPPDARMPAGCSPPPLFVTKNDTPPLPALNMPSAAAPAPMPAGGAPPFFVTNNGTPPPLPALIMPSAAAPAPMPAGGASPFFVTTNGTPPPLPALIMPATATPAPMPPTAASLHVCSALPGIVSNIAPAPPPLPLMAPLPARALHSNTTALGDVYSYTNAPAAHAPPSATPSSSPLSLTSFGSGRGPSSATSSSETEFLQPQHHIWVVPRKLRSPPSVNRRKRPWLLNFPLHALPPVVAFPPQANPTSDDDDAAAKIRNAMALVELAPTPGNNTTGGGGIRRRRPAPRQRNRQAQRVCSHCHSPETPQWRAGPDGPGTLCNACGIRYAANRLLPEYRPSTAPSFRSGQHSNRHRKVMKLREQMTMPAATTAEEKPKPLSLLEQRQPMMMVEDDRRRTKEEDDDGGFLGVCEYISAASL